MVNCNIEKKERFSSLIGLLDKFIFGMNFPVFTALITLISFMANIPLAGFIIFVLIATYVFAFKEDITPILSMLLYFVMMFNDLTLFENPVFYIAVVPVAVALITHFIRFPLKNFNFGKMFLPLCCVIIALFLGGILSEHIDKYDKGLGLILPLGPVVMIIYLLFANYIKYPEGFDIKKYFMQILALAGLILIFEFWFKYYDFKIVQNKTSQMARIGWGNINTLASMLLITIPATCYLIVKTKYFLSGILTVIISYFTVFSTESDGCFGIALVFLPFLALFVLIHLKGKRKRFFIFLIESIFLLILICLLALHVIKDDNGTKYIVKATEKIKGFLSKGDSGRTELYYNSLNVFKRNPLFGGGLGYFNDFWNKSTTNENQFFFHSTFFQILGGCGIVGIAAYVYYYVERYKILTAHNTPFNVYAFFSFTIAACYGMIDCVEFVTFPLLTTITVLILITEFANVETKTHSDFPLNNIDFII